MTEVVLPEAKVVSVGPNVPTGAKTTYATNRAQRVSRNLFKSPSPSSDAKSPPPSDAKLPPPSDVKSPPPSQVFLKCPSVLEDFLETEQMAVKKTLRESRKLRRKCDKVIAKMAHESDWETYAMQEPRDAALSVFMAMDLKGMKAWAKHAVEHIHFGHLRQMANMWRTDAVKFSRQLQTEATEQISAGEYKLVQIGKKMKEAEERVHLGPMQHVAKRERDDVSSGDDFVSKKVHKKGPPAKKKSGPKKSGPKQVVPKQVVPNNDGPNNDGPFTTPILAADGKKYTPQAHWVPSARSSSRFKGVSYDRKRRQWRVKVGNSTLFRGNTLADACEFYHDHVGSV